MAPPLDAWPLAWRELRRLAGEVQLPPRSSKRLFYVCLYSWLLRRCGPWQAALLLALFLLWLWWDATKVCELKEVAVRAELALPLRVVEFAQGSSIGSGSAVECPTYVDSEASKRFADVRRRTQCLFAPKALVWGNDWLEDAEPGADGLAANVARCLPRLYRFCLEVRAGQPLDGFVFEVRGAAYGADVQSFARTVRRVLSAISAADPAGVDCFRKSSISKKGWYFQFAREPLFVTTFAPCYPESNPRYQFGVHPDSCFVLFQPEESFYRRDLPPDKPRRETNWEQPADVRDRIRANFRRQGREYRIPETTSYPPAEFIVLPLRPLEEPPVEFWRWPGSE